MPRHYKPKPGAKRYKTYDKAIMKQALDELLLNRHETIRSIAKKFDMSRSVLQRYCTREIKPIGGQLSLSKEQEEHILLNLNICAEWGYSLDAMDLRYIVKNYLDTLEITHKRFKNNFPGRDFAMNFLERHKNSIALRLCHDIKRATTAVTSNAINEYFSLLEKSTENVPSCNIVNYDETSLLGDPNRLKVLTKRGYKHTDRVLNNSEALVSLMIAGTAEGELLPPYVVYKSTHMYDTWVSEGSENARYNRNSSGWFDAEVFKDWIKEVIIPFFASKTGKKILIGDNLSSHISIDVIRICKSHNINFVFVPANSIHLTQPLYIAFFKPMEMAWRQILKNWKETDDCLSIQDCFPIMLKMLMEQLQISAQNNIQAAFCKTGISPLNRNEVLSRLPMNTKNEEDNKEETDKSALHILKLMRYENKNVLEEKKKRKKELITGQSLSDNDIDNSIDTETDQIQTEQKIKKNEYPKHTQIQTQKSRVKVIVIKNSKNSLSEQNISLSPVGHGSRTLNSAPCNTVKETNNITEFLDYNETNPLVLSEDHQSYEEIVIPYEVEEFKTVDDNTEEILSLDTTENNQKNNNGEALLQIERTTNKKEKIENVAKSKKITTFYML